jgi:hypothetical protein
MKLILLIVLLPFSFLYSQYQADRYVNDIGGGKMATVEFTVYGSLGQQFSGVIEGISNKVTSGFLYTYSLITGTDESEYLPQEYILYQNYPNPFNPVTKIRYELPEEAAVTVTIYNMLGEEVEMLVNNVQGPGKYEVQWSAVQFASGFYICRIDAGKYISVKKLVLLK